jgi:hypothetical protein
MEIVISLSLPFSRSLFFFVEMISALFFVERKSFVERRSALLLFYGVHTLGIS